MNPAHTFILIAVIGGIALIALALASSGFPDVISSGNGNFGGTTFVAPIENGVQEVDLRATSAGTYNYSTIVLQQGIPVRIHYTADPGAGCGREVIIPLAKARKLAPIEGEALIEFTPTEKGEFPFYCSMRMFRGTIEVV